MRQDKPVVRVEIFDSDLMVFEAGINEDLFLHWSEADVIFEGGSKEDGAGGGGKAADFGDGYGEEGKDG